MELVNNFSYTTKGYTKAKKWLKEVGEWEYVSTHGFSTDGWSIVDVANSIYRRKQKEKEL